MMKIDLLSTLLIIFIIVLIAVVLKRSGTTKEKEPTIPGAPVESDEEEIRLNDEPDHPPGFGYKNAWLAIKTNDPQKVIQVLDLQDLRKANWETGLYASYRNYETTLFVTPPIKNWVFVVGMAIPDVGHGYDAETFKAYLLKIGKSFEDVQYFGTYRVAGYHSWARVINGEFIRGYAYLGESGETLWNEGDQTPEEIKLGLIFFDERETDDKDYWKRDDLEYPDEEYVMKLAHLWSLNPSQLENQNLEKSTGFVGRIRIINKK